MNIYFSSTHLQTLCDLKTLAEKHNCYIRFGVNQENSTDVDFNEFDGMAKRIIEELQDKGEFLNQNYCKTSMFFELFDANNSTYNILTYSNGEQSVYYKRVTNIKPVLLMDDVLLEILQAKKKKVKIIYIHI